MTAPIINTMIDGVFALTGAYAITVDGVAKDVNTSTPALVYYYRQALAKSAGTGTEIDPKSFANHLGSKLGAAFSVGVSVDGKYTIRRVSGAGAGVVWSSGLGLVVRTLCGFTADVNPGVGVTVTATNPPPYRILSISKSEDSEFQPRSAGGVWTRTGGNVVYGFGSALTPGDRQMTFSHHPRDPVCTVASSIPATPVLPDRQGSNSSRMTNPVEADLSTTVPCTPMSVLEFWQCQRGKKLGATFGQLQAILTGSVTKFEIVMLDAETCKMEKSVMRLVRPDWEQLWSFRWGFSVLETGAS